MELSRALVAGEALELRKVGSSDASDNVAVLDTGLVRVDGLKRSSARLTDGGVVEVEGVNLSGLEILEVILDRPGETTWYAATLTQSTTTALVFELPDLSLSSGSKAVIRIYNNGTDRHKLYSTFATIVPD